MSLWKTLSAILINNCVCCYHEIHWGDSDELLLAWDYYATNAKHMLLIHVYTDIAPIANQHKKHLLLMFSVIIILWYIDFEISILVAS